ncbi:MAG: DUF4365 domain-containing protein [Collinsella sp.]|nr:DUF4365 domain-containing protein [Collinsella sp.]
MGRQRGIETKKVEKAAVLAVQNLIHQCLTIDEKLDADDKNMLVDGPLELYCSSNMVIPNLIGRIQTQVKGTTRGARIDKRGFARFSIKIENLKRYRDVFHGIIFFYVLVDHQQLLAREVYYAQLLPYDIGMILNATRPGQKYVSVRFKPFPTDSKEITRLLMAFHKDWEIQLKADTTAYGFFDEHMTLPQGVKSIKFSTQLFPGESPTAIKSFRAGPYIYGEHESGRLEAIGKMGDISACAIGGTATISTGGFSTEAMLMVGEAEDGDFLEFEGVRICLSAERCRLDYTMAGGIRKRLRTARFVQEFAKSGLLLVNGGVLLRSTALSLDDDQRCRLNEAVETYGTLVETLDFLHIDIEWDVEKLSAREWSDLASVHRLIVEKKPLTDRELESPLVYFDIQGSRIYTLALRQDDGSYEFSDLYSNEVYFAFGDPDTTTGELGQTSDPVGAFAALNEDGYRTIANIDLEKIEESFAQFPVTPGNQNPLNQTLLAMLAAFDKGCVQPKKLIDAATLLATKMYEADEESDICYLNLMQTLKRRRELDGDERHRLRDIAIDGGSYYMKAAAFALLDEMEMAENCLQRCEVAERRQIEDYPIRRFFQ